MGKAARIELTNHPGFVVGGASRTLINFLPAARVGDPHTCLMPPTAGPHPPSKIVQGSASVYIEGQAAARLGDAVGCGASITTGSADVFIGG